MHLVPAEAIPSWSVDRAGFQGVINALADWKPDVIYAHGALNAAFDMETSKVAPTAFFVHNYHGTCVGGMKAFKKPRVTPCSRRFGWNCLVHYYPRRCGGLNPVTMLRQFHTQGRRLRAVLGCDAVVTHSHHMYCEFLKHGVPPERLHQVSFFASGEPSTHVESRAGVALPVIGENNSRSTGWRIAFIGRMDKLKGGGMLLDALPRIVARLNVPLEVTFAGDGPAKGAWEQRAVEVTAGQSNLRIQFTGWLAKPAVDEILTQCDLVVVPSLWPEPFGLIGPEAGWRGVPVAAFAVGGIRKWLVDGVNGFAAPGDPPTADGLADAIVRCLQDATTHATLRRGALEIARRFNREDHLRALLRIFEAVRANGRKGGHHV